MSSDVESKIIKQGCLHRYSTSKKKWTEKYYVLYNSTPQRLDWYDNAKAYKTNPTIRMSLFIEEILQIERFSPPKNAKNDGFIAKKYMLKLQSYRSPEKADYLSAATENDANDWLLNINQLVEAARARSRDIRTDSNLERRISDDCYKPNDFSAISFDVEVDDTAAANLCELYAQYKLVLSSHHMTLVDQSDEPVLTWEYCNIRRYGYGAERFTIEGGHNAGSAQGLFLFKNCDGYSIRKAYETKLLEYQQLKQQNLDRDPYAYVDVVTGVPGVDTKPAEGNSSTQETVSRTTSNGPVVKPKPSTGKKPTQITTPSPTPASKTISSNSVSRTSSDSSGGYVPNRPAPSAPAHSRSSSKSSNDDNPGASPTTSSTGTGDAFRPHVKNPVVAKFSQVIGQMNKIKLAKAPKAPDGRLRGTSENASEGQYDQLDLSLTTRNYPLSHSTGVGSMDGYDPTHVYGPIELPTTSGGTPTVIESEYAELRT